MPLASQLQPAQVVEDAEHWGLVEAMEAERLEHVRREADKMRAKAEQATPQRAGWDGACDGWARGRMAEPVASATAAKGRPGSLSRRLG